MHLTAIANYVITCFEILLSNLEAHICSVIYLVCCNELDVNTKLFSQQFLCDSLSAKSLGRIYKVTLKVWKPSEDAILAYVVIPCCLFTIW